MIVLISISLSTGATEEEETPISILTMEDLNLCTSHQNQLKEELLTLGITNNQLKLLSSNPVQQGLKGYSIDKMEQEEIHISCNYFSFLILFSQTNGGFFPGLPIA